MNEPDHSLRGRCHELAKKACEEDPTLRLVRGHYYCAHWGEQPHWWAEKPDGTIVDPTAAQFPSGGRGAYIEFDGFVECEECGKCLPEAEMIMAGNGNHPVCSDTCYGRLVGVL